MSFKVIKVSWNKDLNQECELCGSLGKDNKREVNVIKKYFLGVRYCKTIVCQGCVSRMSRNFTKGL